MRPDLLAGTVPIDGLIFEPASEVERALRAWVPGSRLDRLDDGRLLLSFGEPRLLRVDTALGAPVLRSGPGWVDHRRDEPVAPGTVAVLRGGTLVPRRVLGPVDPGVLLDLSAWTVVRPLAPVTTSGPAGTSAAPAAAPALEPEPDALDVRAALTGLPPPDDATQQRWRELAEASPH